MRRLAPLLLVALPALGGCAGAGDDAARTGEGERFAACAAEMRAFVALARIVRQQGDDWLVYEPALQAMKEQILDCVEESYRGGIPI